MTQQHIFRAIRFLGNSYMQGSHASWKVLEEYPWKLRIFIGSNGKFCRLWLSTFCFMLQFLQWTILRMLWVKGVFLYISAFMGSEKVLENLSRGSLKVLEKYWIFSSERVGTLYIFVEKVYHSKITDNSELQTSDQWVGTVWPKCSRCFLASLYIMSVVESIQKLKLSALIKALFLVHLPRCVCVLCECVVFDFWMLFWETRLYHYL